MWPIFYLEYFTVLSKVNGETPGFTEENSSKLKNYFNEAVRSTAKKHIINEHEDRCVEKLKSLAVQGKTLELAVAAETDFSWKSYLYDMRAGTMKFLLNATVDTLPTAAKYLA